MQDYNKQGGNTTYIKDIAKIQFVESFLRIIKTDYSTVNSFLLQSHIMLYSSVIWKFSPNVQDSSPDRNSMHYLFIAWLRKQGFATVDEIERDLSDVTSNISQTSETLEEKLMLEIEVTINYLYQAIFYRDKCVRCMSAGFMLCKTKQWVIQH